MNIGEKISLYKEKLSFKNYQEFGKAVGISGDWINELSKKSEVKFVDMNNLVKLCAYLSISIDQLVIDDNIISDSQVTKTNFINETCDDIGSIIDEMCFILNKDTIKLNGTLLNDSAKLICKDALDTVKILTKQYL